VIPNRHPVTGDGPLRCARPARPDRPL